MLLTGKQIAALVAAFSGIFTMFFTDFFRDIRAKLFNYSIDESPGKEFAGYGNKGVDVHDQRKQRLRSHKYRNSR